MLLNDALTLFLTARLAEGKSKKTITFYKVNVKRYFDYLQEKKRLGSAWSHPETVEQFLAHERTLGLSDLTAHARFRALRAFCNWMAKRDYLQKSPIDQVQEPKRSTKIPKRIPLPEFTTLIESIPAGPGATWVDYRDRLLIDLLFWTRLRLGELVNLDLGDVDTSARLLTVRVAKGRRARLVPYPPHMADLLTRYLFTRPPSADAKHLFWGTNGGPGIGVPLQHSGLQQMLKRRCRKAGLRKYGPHAFRHSFAMAMLNKGQIEMGVLSKLLGHRSTAVTQSVYADWETSSLQRAYDEAFKEIASDLKTYGHSWEEGV